MKIKLLIGILFFVTNGVAQDFSNIKEQKPFEISGNLNLGINAYQTSRLNPQFNPLGYLINASPTLSFYGIDIPFTVIYSERERSFRQPFNRVGASPSYKWVKLHLGQRNVHFNPYTLAGHTFLGYGVELTPGIFKIGFIKGRFNKEIRNIAGIESFVQPAFERKGWAANIGLGNQNNYLDFSLLRIADEAPKLASMEDFGNLTLEENLAIGVRGSATLFKVLTFDLNLAGSIYSENQNGLAISEIDAGLKALDLIPSSLLTPRVNTTIKFARDVNLGYQNGPFGLKLGYKRIDPDYKSLGAYRFLTDIIDYTISPSVSLLQRRLRINLTYGYQRNNTTALRLQTSTRTIGSANISFQSKQGFSSSLNYGNYRVDAISVDDEILSDSFDIIQVSENLNLRANFPLRKDKKNNISINYAQQKFNREIMAGDLQPENISRNITLTFIHRPKENGLGYSIGTNAQLINGYNSRNRIGGRVQLNKKFGKLFRLNLTSNLYQTTSISSTNFLTISSGLRLRYKVFKKQSISASIRSIQRLNNVEEDKSISDLRALLNYNIGF